MTVLAALVLAAAAAATPPLGVWPSTSGPAASTVDDVEFYMTEPDADYWILAIQPLPKPLASADAAELKRLAALARKLGADAVVLLGELPADKIPEDMDKALPATGRIGTTAVFARGVGTLMHEVWLTDEEAAKVRFDGLYAFDLGPRGSPVLEGFASLARLDHAVSLLTEQTGRQAADGFLVH